MPSSNRAAETQRQTSNVETFAWLQLERYELRRLRAADASLIKDMGLRLNRMQSVAKVSTFGRGEMLVLLVQIVISAKRSHTLSLSNSIFEVASATASRAALEAEASERRATHSFKCSSECRALSF